MKKIILLSILLILLIGLLAAEQIQSFAGSLITNGENWFLQTESGLFILDLAPAEFLSENSLELAAGDEVRISGILQDKTILATVIISEGQVVVMRDGTGKPLWKAQPVLSHVVDPDKCIACRLCLAVCPVDAISMLRGKAVIDTEKCINCGFCLEGNEDFLGCPTSAISKAEIASEE
ncbi:MAG: 4Fe-4S binding protein [Candidatus Cloacimonadales bacterium]